MKTKISIIVLSLLLIIGFTSCNDWLDLRPESEIILDEFWKSESDVDAVLAACYRGLTEDAVVYRMIVWGELRSDNIVEGSGFPNERKDIGKILDGELLSTNGYSSWASYYTVINYCNTLLYYAPFVVDRDENFTKDDLNKVRAEALTIRALCYFYLVRTFKEVPLITDASVDDTQDYAQPKATERQLLDTIQANLLEAKKYARKDYGRTDYNKQRVTLNTVNALLADVYLWDQKYSECVAACNEVLADQKLKLIKQELAFTRVFYLGTSTESIFEIPQFQNESLSDRPIYNLYGGAGDMIGELGFPTTLAHNTLEAIGDGLGAYSPFYYKIGTNLYESEDDIRAKDSYMAVGGRYSIFKYAGVSRTEALVSSAKVYSYRYRSDISNWIIYRLSDIMLMKAEALVQMDGQANFKSALEMVNTTYLRSNEEADSLKIANYPTKGAMESLVLRERHRELLFEGKRWFDLVRLARREKSTSTLNDFVGHKATGTSTMVGAPVLDAMYMPILERELEANPQLKQNPYYEEANSSSTR